MAYNIITTHNNNSWRTWCAKNKVALQWRNPQSRLPVAPFVVTTMLHIEKMCELQKESVIGYYADIESAIAACEGEGIWRLPTPYVKTYGHLLVDKSAVEKTLNWESGNIVYVQDVAPIRSKHPLGLHECVPFTHKDAHAERQVGAYVDLYEGGIGDLLRS